MRQTLFWLFLLPAVVSSAQQPAAISYDTSGFFLNGRPFRIWSGEMHFQRIPRLYWHDRLLKAKAMGLNTVATYVFWNAVEPQPGRWNFRENNDLTAFIREAKALGLYVILRPGPYACAEWDFGGLPAWLLAKPGLKIRSSDPGFIRYSLNYIQHIGELVAPFQVTRGGNVILLQVENEFGSYGKDPEYLQALRNAWREAGIDIPLYTADGASRQMLDAGSIPGCVVGLDPGANAGDFEQARTARPDVPAFCSEYYPGWLTHWGEPWARTDTAELLRDLEWLILNRKSWNLYVVHGGTSFGYYAGANWSDRYQPDVTSYDYDAPIREDGSLTPKYRAIRRLLQKYSANALPETPPPVIRMQLGDISMQRLCSVFSSLPEPVLSVRTETMEQLGQNFGFILYRTTAAGFPGGNLNISGLHDYANIYADGQYIGSLDRTQNQSAIPIPACRQLDILVEAMGRINYGPHMTDPKGITDKVTLNDTLLENWNIYNLPFEAADVARLRPDAAVQPPSVQPGQFFRGVFYMNNLGDTYLDLSGWEKGIVWVNGHNLGRYWNKGPQQRLYLPGAFLLPGKNEIVVFDLHRTSEGVLKSAVSLD